MDDSELQEETEEVIRGSGIYFLGGFGESSRFLYNLFVSRFVGAEVFGLYTLGWSLVDFVGKFGLFGLDRSVIHFMSRSSGAGAEEETHRTIGQVLRFGLIASLVATAVGRVFAPWVAASVFHRPNLRSILDIMVLSIPFLVLSSILLASLRAVKIVKYSVYVKNISEPFVLLLSGILLYAFGWTLPGLAFAYLAAAASDLVLSCRFFGRVFPLSQCAFGAASPPLKSSILSFSAPIPFDDALRNVMARLDLFILAMFLSPASLGIYAATCEVAGIVKNIRQSVDPIFFPVASGLFPGQQKERLSDLFAAAARWILVLELAFLLCVGLWGGMILSLFGPAFKTGFWSLVFLSVGYAVDGALGPSETLLLVAGRSGVNLLNTLVVVAVDLGLNLLLIPRYGMIGAALSVAFSWLLMNLLRIAEVRFFLGIDPFRRSLLRPFAAAALAFFFGFFILKFGAPWSYLSVLSMFLYFGLFRAFGLETEDRELLRLLHARAAFLRPWARAWDRVGAWIRNASGGLRSHGRRSGRNSRKD